MVGDALHITAVVTHDADVAGTIDVDGDRDAAAIRAPGGLEVVGGPPGQGDGSSALGWDFPDVAAHGERDPLAVGAVGRIERPGGNGGQHVPLDAVGVAIAVGAHS